MKPLSFPPDLVQAVRDVQVWRPQFMLPFEATEDDCAAALRCVQDDPLGQGGLQALERGLERATGLPCAVGVASGTAALELALRALGVKAGDAVVVPAMTFAGAASAVMHCGATPYFVDCLYSPPGAIAWFKMDRQLRLLAGIDRLRIKAVIAVDLFGQPSVTPELVNLCEEFGLALVEDAAQALGSEIGPRGVHAATLSFNNNKIVTTLGGGAVLTRDPELAERVRHLATTARRPSPYHYDYDEVGFNYRLPNLLAALGVSQLERLGEIKRKKRALAVRYGAALRRVQGFKFVEHPPGSNAWLNCALVDPPHDDDGARRDKALEALTEAGFGCRALFTPLHMVEPYKACPRQRDLGIAEDLFYRAVCLPSGVEP